MTGSPSEGHPKQPAPMLEAFEERDMQREAAQTGKAGRFHWCCELMQGGSAAFLLTENHVSSWSFHIVARLTA